MGNSRVACATVSHHGCWLHNSTDQECTNRTCGSDCCFCAHQSVEGSVGYCPAWRRRAHVAPHSTVSVVSLLQAECMFMNMDTRKVGHITHAWHDCRVVPNGRGTSAGRARRAAGLALASCKSCKESNQQAGGQGAVGTELRTTLHAQCPDAAAASHQRSAAPRGGWGNRWGCLSSHHTRTTHTTPPTGCSRWPPSRTRGSLGTGPGAAAG